MEGECVFCEVLVTPVSSAFIWEPFGVELVDMEMCVSNFPQVLYK